MQQPDSFRDLLYRARAMSVRQRRAVFGALPAQEQETLLALALHHIHLARKTGFGKPYAAAAKEVNLPEEVPDADAR